MGVVATAAADRRTPPELLAEMLREDRAAGFSFAEVFEEDVECAARSASDRNSWREALLATRRAWHENWDNAPRPRSGALTRDLADDARDDSPRSVLLG